MCGYVKWVLYITCKSKDKIHHQAMLNPHTTPSLISFMGAPMVYPKSLEGDPKVVLSKLIYSGPTFLDSQFL